MCLDAAWCGKYNPGTKELGAQRAFREEQGIYKSDRQLMSLYFLRFWNKCTPLFVGRLSVFFLVSQPFQDVFSLRSSLSRAQRTESQKQRNNATAFLCQTADLRLDLKTG